MNTTSLASTQSVVENSPEPQPLDQLLRHIIRSHRMLLIGYLSGFLISAFVVVAALYSITKNPTWEFLVIALISLILADIALYKAQRHQRQMRQWKNCLDPKNTAH